MTVSECVEIEIEANQLAEIILGKREAVIVDCRCFSDYNHLHVKSAVNAFYSKLMRKRIEANKVDSTCLLGQILGSRPIVPTMMDLVLYADSEQDNHQLPQPGRISHKRRFAEQENSPGESSAKVIRLLREKLEHTNVFNNILTLKGGFNSFRNHYPELCESSTLEPQTQGVVGGGGMSNSSFIPGACSLSSRVSLSQPCLPHGTDGPTQILPFLYLGSQQDALDQETLKKHNITYVLNLSLTCPKSDILQSDEHFMRIPVNDNYQEKLLPYFVQAFNFLEKVRERGAVVLIHCLAGISRSPTVAISYIMRHKKMGSDEAYRFVKSKRESISPNFNFMGQLLEYERILRDDEKILPQKSDSTAPSFAQKQDFCPAKVPKSCSAMSLFSSLPSSFSTCSSTEESLPPNEHGKRGMGPAQTGNLEKLGSLDGSAIASNLSRPVALGLKSRKPVVIPAPLGEELPSPSSELSKLSFSGGLPHVPSIANPCFITENNVQPMAPSMTSYGSVENPIFGKMVPSIPPKMGTCRSLASNKPFVPQKEIEIHSRSTDFDRSFHSASSPPKSQPMQIPQESKKEIKESPRSRFPLNFFALFRKPDHSSEKIARSQTASAGLSTYASRPDNLAEAGVVREKEAHSPPGTSKTSDLTETNSPESGFQEGYKTSPEDRDPDRTSIGSTSSHEIAVQ